MFRHLLKPIWRRKSRNLMLSLEILLTFLVVFAIVAAAGRCYQLYHLPTGFSYDNVWSVQLEQPNEEGSKDGGAIVEKFRRGLQDLPEVEQASLSSFSPYLSATWRSAVNLPDGGKQAETDMLDVSDDFFATLDMSVEKGRVFSAADEGAAETAVVINRQLAETLFPGQDPVGKIISDGEPGSEARTMMKVTGVIEDFRNKGEFMSPTNFVLKRFSPVAENAMIRTVLLKVRPGTSRDFELKLSQQLKLIRNDWSYRISPLGDLRKSMLQETLTPLVVLSVIAGFLLLMVAFGLFGVLWQNTTRRIPEIGLRRATGATSADIYRQIIIEQLLLTSLAMAVGLILLVQLPITGVLGQNLDWPLFLGAAATAIGLMALVSVLCALYPAWQASRLSPTEALHYE